jgi:teichuronic acid biosynthesis glycosyltransferase TuaC
LTVLRDCVNASDSPELSRHAGTTGNTMRICLYTNTALPCIGGQEHVVDALARRFQGQGHEVTVLCPAAPHGIDARDAELSYPVVRHRRFVSTRWFVDWYVSVLDGLRQRFPYDLIHCHNVYPSGYLAALARSRGGPPVVITSHGGDVRTDNPRFRKPGVRDRHCYAVRHADRIIAISPFTEQGFLALGATPRQLCHIPNGVDLDHFANAASRPEALPRHIQPRSYVLYLGRLVRLKGVDVLVNALKHLDARSMPHLVIAGDGPERQSLEQTRSDLGLDTHVSFVGHVQGAAKAWLLQNAFALVIPSREREAFPLVLLEGFAAGCAVVASDAAGLRDLVEPNTTGWVVPRNDPHALAKTLHQLLKEPERSALVRRHVREVAQRYDWRHVTDQHLALYEEVLSESKQLRRAA